MTNRIPKLLLIGLAGAALLAAAGCGGDKQKSDPPALPTTASMHLNLDYFNISGSPADRRPAASTHFVMAAGRVAVVNLAVTAIMIPPEAALALALHTVPSRQSDGSYTWIYTYTHSGEDYQLRLTGKRDGESVNWQMNVVLPGKESQVWFSGWSNDTTHQGAWTFHDFNREGDPAVLTADWLAVSETDAFLDITIVDAEGEYNGTTVTYLVDGAAYSLEFYDSSTAKSWRVDWNCRGRDGEPDRR